MGRWIGPALSGFLIPLLVLCGAAHAAEIEGVKLDDKARVGASELVLNGAGVRTRVFFRVYVGALYLRKKTGAADAAIADAGPKRVAMHMMRDLASDQLFSALEEGLKKNHAPEQLAKLEPQVKQLGAIFSAVKAAKTGDVFLLDYVPGAGTRVTVNGEGKGTVPGEEFNRALLRVWLGEEPADAALKKAMLGG
ncbi:MAG: chalcone isomerase family protein [Betaproteobacteria bacterium]|nr:chalcone isomerase family protein [Betaproteobacteria bacterium]